MYARNAPTHAEQSKGSFKSHLQTFNVDHKENIDKHLISLLVFLLVQAITLLGHLSIEGVGKLAMKKVKQVAIGISCLVLVSCGGGDSNSSGPPMASPPTTSPSPTPTPPPTLSVTLSESAISVDANEGETQGFSVDASFTGNSDDPIIADVDIDGEQFQLAGSPTVSGNSFTLDFETLPFLPSQETDVTVNVRLCTSSSCSTVYPGSTQTLTVSLDIDLDDWEQFQRDPNHHAYVPVRYDPADFELAWEFTDSFADGLIKPSAATVGTIYVTLGRNGGAAFQGTTRLLEIDSVDGTIRRTHDFGDAINYSGPSLSEEAVHVLVTEFSNGDALWSFNRSNLSFRDRLSFEVQFNDFEQPALEGERAYVIGGDVGGEAWSFDTASGTTDWRHVSQNLGPWDSQVPAYDDDFIYYYRGSALEYLDKQTGGLVRQVALPDYQINSLDYEGAPVLDGQGRLILFEGDKNYTGNNPIIAITLSTGQVDWRTAAEYSTAFAIRDGVIYAARQDARVLSAIDSRDGSVLWSTSLPPTPRPLNPDILFGNVIVTENLAFVSSALNTWAIDIENPDHPIVWEAPTGGRLTLTPDNLLLTTDVPFDSKLAAYRLFSSD